MVSIKTKKQRLVDFSFMPSLKCNLKCKYCMYNSSARNKSYLDLKKTKQFISTIDFRKINAIGFYGGEISCDYESYQKIIDLIPEKVIKFIITNGTWSKHPKEYKRFLNFVKKNRLQVFISTTKFHRPFQNRKVLKELAKEYKFN